MRLTQSLERASHAEFPHRDVAKFIAMISPLSGQNDESAVRR
jgi:hypothetical protein